MAGGGARTIFGRRTDGDGAHDRRRAREIAPASPPKLLDLGSDRHSEVAARAIPYAEGCHVLPISPLLAWFFTLVLLLLAGRATARLTISGPLSPAERNRELGHAAMGFGMAVLIAPGVPRPPLTVSACFFSALAAFAAFDWGRRAVARFRGRAVDSCGPTDHGAHLLDPHHAIVGVAMVVMLLRPMGAAGGATGMAGMSGMTMAGMGTGSTPGTAVLLLLAYIWIAALLLGIGMTRVLAAEPAESSAVLSSPATVYACELAMTVLTGLMLLS